MNELEQDGYESQDDVEFENVTNALFAYHKTHAEFDDALEGAYIDPDSIWFRVRYSEVMTARVEARKMLELWTDKRIEAKVREILEGKHERDSDNPHGLKRAPA